MASSAVAATAWARGEARCGIDRFIPNFKTGCLAQIDASGVTFDMIPATKKQGRSRQSSR